MYILRTNPYRMLKKIMLDISHHIYACIEQGTLFFLIVISKVIFSHHYVLYHILSCYKNKKKPFPIYKSHNI